MEAQHTIEWYRKRLGCITGSECGVLMKSGRNDRFSDAAKTYIYQIAGERFTPGLLLYLHPPPGPQKSAKTGHCPET